LYLYHALLRIGNPCSDSDIAAVTDREAYSDAVVSASLKFIELNPMRAKQYPDYNLAILAVCPLIDAWLQLAD
jgi:hypothetical protein